MLRPTPQPASKQKSKSAAERKTAPSSLSSSPSPSPDDPPAEPEGEDLLHPGMNSRRAAWGIGTFFFVIALLCAFVYATWNVSPAHIKVAVLEWLSFLPLVGRKFGKVGMRYPLSVTAVRRRAGYESLSGGNAWMKSGVSFSAPTSLSGVKFFQATRSVVVGSSAAAVGKGRKWKMGMGGFRPAAERLRTWQLEEEFDLGDDFGGGGNGGGGGVEAGSSRPTTGVQVPSTSSQQTEEGSFVNGGPLLPMPIPGSSNSSKRNLPSHCSLCIPTHISRLTTSPLLSHYSSAVTLSSLGGNSYGSYIDNERGRQQIEFEYDEGLPLAPSPRRYGSLSYGNQSLRSSSSVVGYGSAG